MTEKLSFSTADLREIRKWGVDKRTRLVIIKPNGTRVVIDLRNKTKPRKVPIRRSK